jgi:hypothetical protein
MRRWHESGYRALSLLDAVDCIRRRVAFPARAFVLTFDDGYRTDEAFRGLQRSGQSAPRLPHSWRQASRALGGAITPGSRDGRYPAGGDSWRCSPPDRVRCTHLYASGPHPDRSSRSASDQARVSPAHPGKREGHLLPAGLALLRAAQKPQRPRATASRAAKRRRRARR